MPVNSDVVIVFAKYPTPGRVKTRLIGPLTAEQAAEVHRRCLLLTLEIVSAVKGADVILAISPDDADCSQLLRVPKTTPLWHRRLAGGVTGGTPFPQVHLEALNQTIETTPQGDGHLGQRLQRAIEAAFESGRRRVLVVGSDCPQMTPQDIEQALDLLDHHDVVIGPAEDGGYYLIGLRQPAAALFDSIDWSSSWVLAQTEARAKDVGLSLTKLQERRDLDDSDDLQALLGVGEPENRRLHDFISFLRTIQRESIGMENEPQHPPSKVLVVDDNLQNLELLEAYLEELDGVTTIGSTNGEDCLKKVASEKPDLILLDIMMPRMSGFEVCQKLKADPQTADIPIIMVTALHEIGDIERGTEVGTNDFVTKPVNRIDLLTRVKSLLAIRHAQNRPAQDGDA